MFLFILYIVNSIWHTAAFYAFAFRTKSMLDTHTLRRESKDSHIRATPGGDDWHHDILQNLGYFNIAPAVVAYLRAMSFVAPGWRLLSSGDTEGDLPLDVLALTMLLLANGAEAYWNFTIGRTSGRWRYLGQGFDLITTGDAVLTVANAAMLICRAGGVM